MKKVLKKGFTLIELMVVIAIIGILATTLAPKMREQLARAKDAKVVQFLGATRTIVSEMIIEDTLNTKIGSDKVEIFIPKLMSKLDITTKGLITPPLPNPQTPNNPGGGYLIIGGSRGSSNSKLNYGRYVPLGIKNAHTFYSLNLKTKGANIEVVNASDVILVGGILLPESSYSTEGKQWSAY